MSDLAVLAPAGGYYDVLIRRNADGVERLCRTDWDWHWGPQNPIYGPPKWKPDGDLYWWTEGNMGCDCARAMEFAQAVGDKVDPDVECGNTAYTAVKAILPDGQEIEIDQQGFWNAPEVDLCPTMKVGTGVMNPDGSMTINVMMEVPVFYIEITGTRTASNVIDGEAEDISSKALEGPKP